MHLGLDVGSTTVKLVALTDDGQIAFSAYQRHMGKAAETARELIERCDAPEGSTIAATGSAGLGLAERLGLPFVQEVYATRAAVRKYLPATDVAIELGGEDAKILFLTGGLEVRMNGSCAGGTGAFIDQMATLLNVTPTELNELAAKRERVYPIASRCGVFAKSDVQPLVNQGARREDVCASILKAVVDQTIAGLAQGRPIAGNIAYLGGPLTFLNALRDLFDEALNLRGECPQNALYYAALGAALSGQGEAVDRETLLEALDKHASAGVYNSHAPLFTSAREYAEFQERHARDGIPVGDPAIYRGAAYLGVDAGSTTTKLTVVDGEDRLLFARYDVNRGNPVEAVRRFLEEFYERYPQITIAASAVTGYGEELVKSAFAIDLGLVETVAHYTAAKRFLPEVQTIIDIGGQDIKCFTIRNGAIDSLFLNEACSSGCGSFLQTFASALGYEMADFARLGLFAAQPVDLGSRCTVFMNSSVKQAQKDGASMENISAGLSISVVKNALYKVIRAPSPEALGQHIVVQGGTFLNDAVLRAFEMETGRDVVRPVQSGLMGAYGAALYAKAAGLEHSTLRTAAELKRFTHTVHSANCQGCANHCPLSINSFGDGRRYIGGNRCEKPIRGAQSEAALNIYPLKRALLQADVRSDAGDKGTIGIPLGLNMYELLPFWRAFWAEMGYRVLVSPLSDRKLYRAGQHTIPSDTVCYPAKLLHGHVKWLCDQGVEAIFYPCMTYNFDEKLGDNHYNCPVVAYYPEVLKANMPELKETKFLYPYLGPHRRKFFPAKLYAALKDDFPAFTAEAVARAAEAAYAAYEAHMRQIREEGAQIIREARRRGMPILVLAGRPYHADPEISHGVDQLIAGYGLAVVSEDAVSALAEHVDTKVLNQWTYHSRLYAAARYVTTQPDMQLVQLVSFGCGVDAITTDEVRAILEAGGKLYTQLKIDEIANLGAVRIRVRSLFAAMEERKGAKDHAVRGEESDERSHDVYHTHPGYDAAAL